jgi:hypothetical protein
MKFQNLNYLLIEENTNKVAGTYQFAAVVMAMETAL